MEDEQGWHEVSGDLGRVIDELERKYAERRAAEARHAALPLLRRIARRVIRVVLEEVERDRKRVR